MTDRRESQISANVRQVRARIAAAADRSGRLPESVLLVAVTKYVGLPEIQALIAAGCCDLGESRPQSLWEKAAAITDPSIRWHLIGHLQRNKIRRTLPYLTCLHAGDSLRLLTELSDNAAERQQSIDVLLEVNISGDPSKHGFAPEELLAACERIAALPSLRVRGLMAMSGLDSDAAKARAEFAAVRLLRDEINAQSIFPQPLTELSMGMSDDYEQAIAEGATIVRIGSALFEGLDE